MTSTSLMLGVFLPSLNDSHLQNAVTQAIADAQSGLMITPLFLETQCSDSLTLQAWSQLSNVSVLIGPLCSSSCRLTSSLLQVQSPHLPHFNFGCSSLSECSPSDIQVAPHEHYKLKAVVALAQFYNQPSDNIVYIFHQKSALLPLVPLALGNSNGEPLLASSLLYVYNSNSSLIEVLNTIKSTKSGATMIVFDGEEMSSSSNMNFVVAANSIFSSSVGVVFVGMNLDLAMYKQFYSSKTTITVLSITLPITTPSYTTIATTTSISWSLPKYSTTSTINLLYDTTYLYLLAQSKCSNISECIPNTISYTGRTGQITFLDSLERVPSYSLQVLTANTLATVGRFELPSGNISLPFTFSTITSQFNWTPVTWSTNINSLLPYGPVVLGGICITSACSLILLIRMFFSQSCLAARVFKGFSKNEKSVIEDPSQTQMVVSKLEKKAAERRVQIILGLQTLLDISQLILELVAYFGFVMAYETSAARIALYSIGLGVELASLPSILMLRLPIFFRHSPWPWVFNGPKLQKTEVVQVAPASSEPAFTIRKHVHNRQSTVTTLVALQVQLVQLQSEHLEVANSLLRLWLQEVPLLGLNVYYLFLSAPNRTSIILACCVDFVALGFKAHLFHRLTELYVAQRGVHFDIQMAKLESKQRRSSYT
ncbi:hypothetical protein THRCLA_05123 [Thraustotheca clavata]|uniref:Receptor ligand binding region domain-containing protein n=1 Tax=Thraustotheca clavata TaxID=74557 RepID=A0A1V9ZXI7_9STRA|nr:hypothetical protein THRCLA_05123 [Thraustotheca clavata]